MLFQGSENDLHFDAVESPVLPEFITLPKSFYIEFGKNKITEKGRNIFVRNKYEKVNDLTIDSVTQNFIKENEGWGLYYSAFQYSKQDPHVSDLRGDFYLDFDDEDDIGKAQEDAIHVIRYLTNDVTYSIKNNMIRVFFSGSKGIHLVVPYQVFGVEWHPHLDRIYKMMAEDLYEVTPNKTLDMKVYERRRLFRLPRSQHPSTGSYKVPMELSTLLIKSEKEIQELSKDKNYGSNIAYQEPVPQPRAVKTFEEYEAKYLSRYNHRFSNNGKEASLDYDPKEYLELIEQGPVKGCRNEVASILTTFWRRRGKTEQDAWDLLVEWNGGSLPESELRTLFKSNFHGPYVYSLDRVRQYLQ